MRHLLTFRGLSLFVALLLVLSLLSACSLDRKATEPRWLVLLTTTELSDSGLLEALLPPYEQATGVRVKRLVVTTAKALDYAALAGIDVVLLPGGAALDKLAGAPSTFAPPTPQPTPTPGNMAYPTAGANATEPPLQAINVLYNERRVALWAKLTLAIPTSADTLSALTTNPDFASKFMQTVARANAKFYSASPAQEPGLALLEKRLGRLVGVFDNKDRGSGFTEFNEDSRQLLRRCATDGAYCFATVASFELAKADNGERLKSYLFPEDVAFYLPYEIALPNNVPTQDRDVKLARTLANYLLGTKAQEIIGGFKPPNFSAAPYRPWYAPVFVPVGNLSQ